MRNRACTVRSGAVTDLNRVAAICGQRHLTHRVLRKRIARLANAPAVA
jgi:hypothetical protein